MNQYLKNGAIALAVTLATLIVWAKPAAPDSRMYAYGYPLSFVRQTNAYEHKTTDYVRIDSPWEHPTTVNYLNFIIDLVLIYGLVWVIGRQMKKTR